MADSSLKSDFGAICSCEVSVQDCLDRLAELNKFENANESTAQDICRLQLLGARLHLWAVRWDTLRGNMSASVAPAARIQGSLNIIPDLVDYLIQSYEDKYDKTQAIIERQDMAVSNEAVQERFKRLHDQIQELEGFLPSSSALNGAVIFNHALSAHPEDLRTLSPQKGIDDFTMTLARLKATSLSHVNLISFDMRDRPWRVNADLKYLRDNEGRRSYFAEYNNRLVLVSEKNIPSGSISCDTSLQRLAWQLKISEDIKELRTLPFLGYSYEYPLSSNHTRHKVLYSIHGKDAISLRDMLRTKNIDHFRSLLSHTMRFELAQSLAQSILYLHTAGWLHRGIRSSHIIFCSEREFFSDTHEQLEQLDLPYLAGFDYTYLPPYDAEDEKLQVHIKERQLYRHPDVQHDPTTTYDATIGDNDPSFTKNHDIYSFGVILVELGLLRSALRIWLERSREKCNGSRKFQSYLITELIPKVRSRMGSIYADVALYCLRSNSYVPGEPDCIGSVAFYKNVIAQLERGKKSLCGPA